MARRRPVRDIRVGPGGRAVVGQSGLKWGTSGRSGAEKSGILLDNTTGCRPEFLAFRTSSGEFAKMVNIETSKFQIKQIVLMDTRGRRKSCALAAAAFT